MYDRAIVINVEGIFATKKDVTSCISKLWKLKFVVRRNICEYQGKASR